MSFSIEAVEDKVKGLFQGKKKWVVIGGGVAVIALFVYMKKRQAAATGDNSVYTSGYPTLPDYSQTGGTAAQEPGITADDLALLRDNFNQSLTDLQTNLSNQVTAQIAGVNSGWADTFNNFSDNVSMQLEHDAAANTTQKDAAAVATTSSYAATGTAKTYQVDTSDNQIEYLSNLKAGTTSTGSAATKAQQAWANEQLYLTNMAKGVTASGGKANAGQQAWAKAELEKKNSTTTKK